VHARKEEEEEEEEEEDISHTFCRSATTFGSFRDLAN